MQPHFKVMVPAAFLSPGKAMTFDFKFNQMASSVQFKEHMKKLSLLDVGEAYSTAEGVMILRVQ